MLSQHSLWRCRLPLQPAQTPFRRDLGRPQRGRTSQTLTHRCRVGEVEAFRLFRSRILRSCSYGGSLPQGSLVNPEPCCFAASACRSPQTSDEQGVRRKLFIRNFMLSSCLPPSCLLNVCVHPPARQPQVQINNSPAWLLLLKM